MNFDPDYIKELVLDKIAGTIDEESALYLEKLIAENPEALKIYQTLHEQYTTEYLHEVALQAQPNESIILHKIRKQKTRQLWLKATAGIAAAVVISVGTYLLLSRNSSPDHMPIAANQSKQIMLQLPGGQAISLSSRQGEINVGNTHLSNNNKTLTYSSHEEGSQKATIIVPPGKDYTVQLDDGTQIQLNAATHLEFPLKFTGNTREVSIIGEAYIKVTKDPKRPFIVHLPHSTVQVLGTEFNVNTYEVGQERVALVEGSVKMAAGNRSLLLTPGNEATVTEGEEMKVDAFSARERLSWRRGLYFFHNATFEEVSRILPRWFGVEVIIENRKTGKSRFTGFIDRNAPISQSLDLLKETNAFNYVIVGDTVFIR
ncbi:FecR family protein [Chitinophaga filiformis]|uniref:FecR domain-containing protein n=1 Tax=Chitinophaga filiformis TaxID=104663 RepID=A0ABY4HWT0_CHIFI|nr:FecR domain-containing protein [Chitinophaga filiformis]UPK68065.1 FecR domain-containing protein [Chitinophaga filiformis]